MFSPFTDDIKKVTLDANSIIKADVDNTPVVLTVAEQTFVGRKTGGTIDDLSASEARTILNIEEGTAYALLAGRSGGQTLIGGTGVTDAILIKGTSGNGTVTVPGIKLNVGNNGGTIGVTILNNGDVGFGLIDPLVKNHLIASGAVDLATRWNLNGVANFQAGFNNTASTNGFGAVAQSCYLGIAQAYPMVLATSGTERIRITSGGNTGFGVASPTAVIHLKAGTATADTAPLQFSAGTVETTPRAGVVEFDGTDLFLTL